jgi:hypothetical protein
MHNANAVIVVVIIVIVIVAVIVVVAFIVTDAGAYDGHSVVTAAAAAAAAAAANDTADAADDADAAFSFRTVAHAVFCRFSAAICTPRYANCGAVPSGKIRRFRFRVHCCVHFRVHFRFHVRFCTTRGVGVIDEVGLVFATRHSCIAEEIKK